MREFLIISLLLTGNSFASKKCRHTNSTFKCVEYVSNYDGDTLTVTIPGHHQLFGLLVSVRLNGIDTPERRTHNTCEKNLLTSRQNI